MLDNLTPEMLATLSDEDLKIILDTLKALERHDKYNKIELFKPFNYQREFMAKGKEYKTRYLRAGNRTGKTFGAAAEMAYHVTGRYPEWWEGEVVKGSGHTFACIGITLDSVARVIQKELMGTSDCRIKDDLGTGSIPLDCIETKDGWKQDGGRLLEVRIKSANGGNNTILFFGSENEAVLMGMKLRGVWSDEEPPYGSLKLFSQLQTRLLNAAGEGENGFYLFTATPEQGQTKLNDLFDKNENGTLYVHSASIYDNPTYNNEQIEQFLAGVPDYQREMRLHGIPVNGTGQIFRVSDMDIIAEHIQPQAHWRTVIACDFGITEDATVAILATYDPDNEKYYILKEWFFTGKDANNRTPQHLAQVLLNSEYSTVPIIVPHDSTSRGKMMSRLGCNVYMQAFKNPVESQLEMSKYTQNSKSNRLISTGLNEMILLFEDKRLFVSPECFNWFREKRSYSWQYNERTGETVPSATNNHAMDAARYAVMSLMDNKGCEWIDRGNPALSMFGCYETVEFNTF